MSKIYKVYMMDYPIVGENTAIHVRPLLNKWDSFKQEIFKRFPTLEYKKIEISYKGKSN